jgi:flavin reductase (DIM6/NTAB) family NADH-FMN oxidoreductase RutF
MEIQDILERIVNGVAVVTSKRKNDINGLSVAWMTQVSYSPPLVMACVGKEKYTHELIDDSGVFAINILSERQRDVAKLFGLQSGRASNKFSEVGYDFKKSGAPILKDCLAYVDCTVHKSIDVGDTTLFVGEILEASVNNKEKPLIYNSKDYF